LLLAELVSALAPLRLSGSLDKKITGLAYDSRLVEPGNLFVAIPGFNQDGHEFLAEAAARGAVAAIISRDIPVPEQLTSILVTDSRRALAALAEKFFDYPSRQLRLIGVTGTNGKTTTTWLIDSLLRAAGYPVGIIGTVLVRIGNSSQPAVRTTPESLDLQQFLARMVEAAASHAVLEVSSHALALDRVAGCEFDVAVFTNLTQDHLDLHGNMQEYLAAKSQLFSQLSNNGKPRKLAVINLDDAAAPFLLEKTRVPALTYGIKGPANLRAKEISISESGSRFQVWLHNEPLGFTSVPTPGYFSVYNALAAIAVAIHEGVPWSLVQELLPATQAVPGRFQPIRKGQPFTVIIDYAHTPGGLKNVLETARSFVDGRIIVVFGCGGDRDRGKRALMGKVASQLADVIILTADNPRSEDPTQIAADIAKGIAADKDVTIILDRALAIQRAIALACPGDAVLVVGKGHETYQIFAERIIHFDDREVAEQALEVAINEKMDFRRGSSSS